MYFMQAIYYLESSILFKLGARFYLPIMASTGKENKNLLSMYEIKKRWRNLTIQMNRKEKVLM